MMGAKPTATLQVEHKPSMSTERQLADIALDPMAGAAAITNDFSKGIFGPSGLGSTYEALQDRAKAIRGNNLGSAEDTLTAQAAALNAMFLELARRSGANMGEYMQAAETYMRLALKAQAQCRATLETLAAIKNPPVTYAQQANIAHGPQQVNNGLARARERSGKLAERTIEDGAWQTAGARSGGRDNRRRSGAGSSGSDRRGRRRQAARYAPAATPTGAESGRRSELSWRTFAS